MPIKEILLSTGSSIVNVRLRCRPFRVRTTGKNNRFPLLDILGYLKNTHKNPNLAKWEKSQLGNSQPSSLIGTYLTLPNLGFWWVFFKYPKISKNGNLFLFPVNWIDSYCSKGLFIFYEREGAGGIWGGGTRKKLAWKGGASRKKNEGKGGGRTKKLD